MSGGQRHTSRLLINESPLQVLPSLATAIGLNEAILVQQVHYWLGQFQKTKDMAHYRNGRWWVYNSYDQWRTDNFPFWSTTTIKRAALSAEQQGILLTARLSPDARDRRKWYSIDYDALDALTAGADTPDTPDTPEQADPADSADAPDALAQNGPIHRAKMAPSIGPKWPGDSYRDYTETTTHTTAPDGADGAPVLPGPERDPLPDPSKVSGPGQLPEPVPAADVTWDDIPAAPIEARAGPPRFANDHEGWYNALIFCSTGWTRLEFERNKPKKVHDQYHAAAKRHLQKRHHVAELVEHYQPGAWWSRTFEWTGRPRPRIDEIEKTWADWTQTPVAPASATADDYAARLRAAEAQAQAAPPSSVIGSVLAVIPPRRLSASQGD